MAEFWSNVTVEVQSTLGSSVTISGITKASPGVVTTSTSHSLTTGDVVVMSVDGMAQLNGRAFRVTVLTATTFEIEDEDTTDYNTFVSGTLKEVSAWSSMTTATGINVSGGDPEFADITTIHDTIRKQVPTVVSPLQISIDSLFDPADAALTKLRNATQTKTTRVCRFTFSSGSVMVFNAYVSAVGVPTGTAQQSVTTPVSLSVQGLPKVYEA